MTNWTDDAFEAEIRRRIERRDGAAVVALLLEDPQHRYAVAFNDAMAEVDERFIDRAYTRPQDTLAAMVNDGRVRDWTHFLERMSAVLLLAGLHFEVKSYHAANPRVRRGRRQRTSGEPQLGPCDSRPLFVTLGFEITTRPDRAPAPEAPAERAERFRLLLAEARGLGRIPLRIFREVRRYEHERGTSHGAFLAVARSADVDDRGRIRWVRKRLPDAVDSTRPPAAVVRRVRRVYEAACRFIDRRGYFRGLRTTWPG